MSVKQVSVFVENHSGSLLDIISLLGENKIDIKALCIADTVDYGILRLIVDKPTEALNLLKENKYVVKVSDVVAIKISNEPGGLKDALKLLKEAAINVSYLYAFIGSYGNYASVMLKIDDEAKAIKLFNKNGIQLLEDKDLVN
ncbi:amino acid-binding protein [bacterium]|nr:amino acid-binding protein [bacterium]